MPGEKRKTVYPEVPCYPLAMPKVKLNRQNKRRCTGTNLVSNREPVPEILEYRTIVHDAERCPSEIEFTTGKGEGRKLAGIFF